MEFSITSQSGDESKVEADNWLLALAAQFAAEGIDINRMGRVNCIPESDGSIFIDDVKGERSWMVRLPKSLMKPEIQVVASSKSELLVEEEPVLKNETDEASLIDLSVPPPSFAMPMQFSIRNDDLPETLGERLFDLSMDISAAAPDEACKIALDLVCEFVNCSAASIVRGTINDDALTYVAANGPVADQIVGRKVQFGDGLVGMCFDLRSTLSVNDVAQNQTHLSEIDAETGFSTASVLCVPILDDESLIYGVIQLLNPAERRFFDEDEEAVETVAKTLANALAIK